MREGITGDIQTSFLKNVRNRERNDWIRSRNFLKFNRIDIII